MTAGSPRLPVCALASIVMKPPSSTKVDSASKPQRPRLDIPAPNSSAPKAGRRSEKVRNTTNSASISARPFTSHTTTAASLGASAVAAIIVPARPSKAPMSSGSRMASSPVNASLRRGTSS